jgi:hypothetical protein
MTRLGTGWIAVVLLCLYVVPANGQTVAGWYLIERPTYAVATANYGDYAPAPVDATYAPGPAPYAPATNMSTTVSTRWEQAAPATYAPAYAPPVTYTPAVNYMRAVNYALPVNYAPAVNYAPVTVPYAVPTVTYMPVVARYPAPPYVTYAPPAKTCAPPAPVGPKVWVHPKVYVEGQPIRNLIRAVTP